MDKATWTKTVSYWVLGYDLQAKEIFMKPFLFKGMPQQTMSSTCWRIRYENYDKAMAWNFNLERKYKA